MELPTILKISVKSLLTENECMKVLNHIKELGIDNFSQHNSFIMSVINHFAEKLHFHLLVSLLSLIADSELESLLDYEFKSGLKLLLNHHNNDFFVPLFTYIKKKNNIDECFITSVVNDTIFNSNYIYNTSTSFYIEKCFEIIYFTIDKKNQNLSTSFWQLILENSLKINQISYFINLVKIYPVKLFFNKKMWKSIIASFMNDVTLFQIFDLFMDKYVISYEDEKESQFFDNIFNIFIEEISNSYENIELKKKEEIYSRILSIKTIKIEENSFEKYFEKMITFKTSLENFSNIVIQTCKYVEDKIVIKNLVVKILRMFFKKGDFSSIYNMIKLLKNNKLCIKYEDVEIDQNILSELINFLVEHTEYDESGQQFYQLKDNPAVFYSRTNSVEEIINNLNLIKDK